MFCPKCGAELPEGAQFCNKCGQQLGNAPVTPAPRKKEPFKLPTRRGWISLAFSTILFILAFTPFVHPGVSLLSVSAFDAHAMFGLAKIFMIMSMAIYLCYVAVSLIDLGIPAAIKKFIPLAFYGLFAFSQLFTFIGCIIRDGITMGASWYIIMLFVVIATVYEVLPKFFNVDD